MQIISSDNLARVLQKMLTVGNLMNEGTYRGHASGFSLDSLLKMVHTKGNFWQYLHAQFFLLLSLINEIPD